MEAELGVGLTYVRGLEPLFESGAQFVPVLELEPQTLWLETGDDVEPYRIDREAFERVQRLPQRKIVHGIGFPVGGSRLPDPRHLPLLKQSVDALEAPWASEHLSFNLAESADGLFNTGFLLPPRQTRAGVQFAAANIRRTKDFLGRPFAVETGVNYLRPRDDELPDGVFVASVAEAADCGILLDLHNLWANEKNGRQRVRDFINQLPPERVWEIHLAGGSERDGFWLDSHAGAVPEELWDLAADVIGNLTAVRAVIFEVFRSYLPGFGIDGVASQVERLHQVWAERPSPSLATKPATHGCSKAMSTTTAQRDDVSAWEDALGRLVVGMRADHPLARELESDPGLGILQDLVGEFRAGMICDALRLTMHLLLLTIGEAGVRGLLAEFSKERVPSLFRSTEGFAFASFLVRRNLDIPYLAEVLAFEQAVLSTLTTGRDTPVAFPYEPLSVLRALAEGRLPDNVNDGTFEVWVTADDSDVITIEGLTASV